MNAAKSAIAIRNFCAIVSSPEKCVCEVKKAVIQKNNKAPSSASEFDFPIKTSSSEDLRIKSWSKFVSDAYWNVELEK